MGRNVLCLGKDTFHVGQELSLAADLPEGTSLRIVLSGGLWWYRVMPNGPENWDISIYDYVGQLQEFKATSPGERSDVNINFDVPRGSSSKFKIDYYENTSESPTRTREIVVVDNSEPGGGYENDYIFPELGKYGLNLLAMDADTILVDKDATYSLAVQFPNWDDTTSFEMRFNEEGMYTINPSENDHWVCWQEIKSLYGRTDGNYTEADMSIVFTKTGEARLTGDNRSSILLIK
jgi:hypothetical protein